MPARRIKVFPPHLDAPLSQRQAKQLVSTASAVASHAFMPFLQRNQRWTKFALKGTDPDEVTTKDRPILYASRRDSYIFSHYRGILNLLYESEVARLGLQGCVLAYRKIPLQGGRGGKCNIHFACEAFQLIRNTGNCIAVALDVRKFFEHLDHQHIKKMWLRLLPTSTYRRNAPVLPDDHFKIFRAVTQYSFINRDQAYNKLGLIGERYSSKGEKEIGYLRKRDDFPLKICSSKDFREKLADVIQVNPDPFGIPQGSPISDLLANLYMLDFDAAMSATAARERGRYFRYSDDILLILPTRTTTSWENAITSVEDILKQTAPRLELKSEKTQVYEYQRLASGEDQSNRSLRAKRPPDGLEYLGFRYDGRRVFLRNSTVSGIRRKITGVANRMARRLAKQNPTMSLKQLIDLFNYSVLIARFGRVKDFDTEGKKYTSWTFWTYVMRSSKIFGQIAKPILRQTSDYKAFARKKAVEALQYAHDREAVGTTAPRQ